MSSIESSALFGAIRRTTLSRKSSSLRRATGHLLSQGGQAQSDPNRIVNSPTGWKRVSMVIGNEDAKEPRQGRLYRGVVIAVMRCQDPGRQQHFLDIDLILDHAIDSLAVALARMEFTQPARSRARRLAFELARYGLEPAGASAWRDCRSRDAEIGQTLIAHCDHGGPTHSDPRHERARHMVRSAVAAGGSARQPGTGYGAADRRPRFRTSADAQERSERRR